ncbi:MAG TPA: L,D-transpeptidase family protein [Alphaproteobacteria bacterium]|nr:L,D-transpeptidase family protein [Alphaproteobacteria bacterium]
MRLLSLLAVSLCLGLPAAHAAAVKPIAAAAQTAGAERAIAALLAEPALRIAGIAVDTAALAPAYAARRNESLWTTAKGPTAAAQAALAALRDAAADGLDPADYPVGELERLARELTSPEGRARFDLALSQVLATFGRHLHGGRVAPARIAEDIHYANRTPDVAALLRAAAADPAAALAALRPRHAAYARLRTALAAERAKIGTQEWPRVPGGDTLKLGMVDPRVVVLRQRLIATGEMADDAPLNETYDEGVEAAVKAFQVAFGLEPDGAVGRRTLSMMNLTPQERVEKIVATMERWRWLSDDLGDRHVMVNIPGYELQAVEKGRAALRMPVVVGSDERRTPLMSDAITHLVFNPTWTVPLSIAKKDILPKLIENPGYAIEQNLLIYDGWAADAPTLNPYAIDWVKVGQGITRYRLRQEPGPLNALGRVKFVFPNKDDIYLHDTPKRNLFDKARRALSSGCVRVGDPDALAGFILAANRNWTPERHAALLADTATETVWVAKPVKVHLTYQTAWVNDDGAVQYRADIYGRDRELIAALKEGRAGQRIALAN